MAGKKKPKSKCKHRSVQVWKKYSVKDGKIERKGKFCPRCGPGTFLASHPGRVFCGKCGYAEVQNPQK
ncbi:MAG: 30S ribosomal protein S27ae [Candidatus Micrarchaeota archaeon]|nr:30S ribosomal protein S27ae [Candidatus Micrarchaeota archaeon]